MYKKNLTYFLLIFGAILVSGGIVSTSVHAASGSQIREAIINLLGGTKKTAPKQLARISHYNICPSRHLRDSLPQLNIHITVPKNLNVRSGPGTNFKSQARFSQAGPYTVDLLEVQDCWLQVRYKGGADHKKTGWVYSKNLSFKYDRNLAKQ
jgi:uncharacterized protein YgiM (DUF1202 family)